MVYKSFFGFYGVTFFEIFSNFIWLVSIHLFDLKKSWCLGVLVVKNNMTTLIIARHGNTFNAEDTPTRVGARTDLPLVESGRTQAQKIGQWLKAQNMSPDMVYSSQLKRTIETAEIALAEIDSLQTVTPLDIFNEIDYGVDENQTEDKVIARVGAQAIADWDNNAIVPDGWQFDPTESIQNWQNFAAEHATTPLPCVIMVVTSNGIARFAPHLTNDFDAFKTHHKIKLSTGALGILQFENDQWNVKDWNVKP
jgi:probable phosphoglycerate mutase